MRKSELPGSLPPIQQAIAVLAVISCAVPHLCFRVRPQLTPAVCVSYDTGDSDFIGLIFLYLIPCFLFYVACWALLARFDGGSVRERFTKFYSFVGLTNKVDSERSILKRELQMAWWPACRYAVIGTMLISWNVIFSAIGTSDGDCMSSMLAW